MATRGELRDAFYDRLTTAATGTFDVEDANGTVVDTVTLSDTDVDLIEIDENESLPRVIYDENYLPIEYNGVGHGPDYTNYNVDDTVDSEEWREYIEAQFTIYVRASNESVKEPIYEAIHTSFGQLGYGPWPVTDIHADVIEVRVEDASSVDTGDVDDVIRGDQLEVFIVFHRDYELDTDNITDVDASVEGNTYTTT